MAVKLLNNFTLQCSNQVSLLIVETKTRFIKPDVAAVDAHWKINVATDPAGNPWPDRNGLMNLIMTPDHRSWVIIVMHNMDIPALVH